MKQKILVIGSIAYNKIIHLSEFFTPEPQTVFAKYDYDCVHGTAAGKAIALDYLEFDTSLITLIGEDEEGNLVRQYFDNTSIQTLYEIDEHTQRHVNLMNQKGERISIYVQGVSYDVSIDCQKYEKIIQKSDIVIINLSNFVRQFIPILQKYNKEIWVDIHDYDGENEYHKDYIECADVVMMSSQKLPHYKQFGMNLLSNKKLAIVTHGEKGSNAYYKNKEYFQPIISDYDLVDSNGAGDSFMAGYLFGYCRDYSVQDCLLLGSITSALTIQSKEICYPKLTEELLVSIYKKKKSNC